MSNIESKYYSVAVVVDATWKRNIYTYHSSEKLEVGSVVLVPFGNIKKIGLVTAITPKPKMATKEIDTILNIVLPRSSLALLDWLVDYYPSAPGAHLQHILPSFVKNIDISSAKPAPTITQSGTLPSLTANQSRVLNEIESSGASTNVLHGITGSGKTRIYAEIAKDQLAKGNNVLILYPEISLTSQLESTLVEYFGKEKVLIYHSKRKPSEQKNTWETILKSNDGKIIIGPRSALFLPFKKLGYIIIDEAHDAAYKQDGDTRYNGLQVAGALAKTHSAGLLLGSATPPVQETQQIMSKGGKLVCLHELAISNKLPMTRRIMLVDMRQKESRGSLHLLSRPLSDAVQTSLNNSMQSMLFLNRRGTARLLLCENCGWHASCTHCDLPITYHHDTHILLCHICGQRQKTPVSCPDCNHTLEQKSLGTKAIEVELAKMFPGANIARFDSDNKKTDSFTEQFDTVKNGNVDIILGTQLITKGLDLPRLETIGVLQGDSQLLLPDYMSEERAFQQLTQVSGRVGRGHSSGSVYIQTHQPGNSLMELVKEQDWHNYFDNELNVREKHNYPPYSFAIKVWTLKKSQATAEKAIKSFVSKVRNNSNVTILGPAPSFYEKVRGKYAWHFIATSSSRSELVSIAEDLPKDFQYDLDPVSFL